MNECYPNNQKCSNQINIPNNLGIHFKIYADSDLKTNKSILKDPQIY